VARLAWRERVESCGVIRLPQAQNHAPEARIHHH
jgi:hypothetical protein